MGYTALYRKFRPMTFEEVVGQEHITRTLKNQIIANRVGHAYLFNGSRGTGKTSSAKILARAINCLNPQDGNPCNECEICKAALAGSLTDIVEMDAASNNSVEDIRAIREEVNFLPTKAKYRVYIIDEVHMLSTGAFNALLKTLEEPPEHVKFILATTEPQKLPATILSRCQRFDFKRISEENIIKRLEVVCKESNIQATEGALNVIAALSEGAMRDALSILERCVQDGENSIDEEKVKDLVGIPKTTSINKIVEGIINYDVDTALITVDQVLQDGKDIDNLLLEIIKYVKDILVYKVTGKLNLYNNNEMQNIKKLAGSSQKEALVKLIYDISELQSQIKWSTQKVIVLEAGIIKLCSIPQTYIQQPVQAQVSQLQTAQVQATQVQAIAEKSKTVTTTANTTTNLKQYPSKTEEYWPKIVNELKQSGKIVLYTNLIGTRAKELNDMTVGIEFPKGMTAFGKTVLEKQENIKELTKLVSMASGKPMQIKYITPQTTTKPVAKTDELKNIAKNSDIPFNVIE